MKNIKYLNYFAIFTFIVLCIAVFNIMARHYMDNITIDCEVKLINEQRDWGGSIPAGSRIHVTQYLGNDLFFGFSEDNNRTCSVNVRNIENSDEVIDTVNTQLTRVKCVLGLICAFVVIPIAIAVGLLVNRLLSARANSSKFKIIIICCGLFISVLLFYYASKIYCVFNV